MNIIKLILNNIVSIAIFGLILFFSSYLPLGATIGLGIIWLAYMIYSNYDIVIRTNDLIYQLNHANKKNYFEKQVAITKTQIESMQGRMEVLKELEDADTIESICKSCEAQFYNNVNYIIALMGAFDYITKPKSQRQLIDDMVAQNSLIISKLNELIEKEIMIDKSVHDTDINQVDDLIESLKELISDTAN